MAKSGLPDNCELLTKEQHDARHGIKPTAGCDCIKSVNEKLAFHNSRINIPLFGPKLPFIETIKLDEKKRGKPTKMFATFCPFCGTKFPDAKMGAA
jgi:hypothetical protein